MTWIYGVASKLEPLHLFSLCEMKPVLTFKKNLSINVCYRLII